MAASTLSPTPLSRREKRRLKSIAYLAGAAAFWGSLLRLVDAGELQKLKGILADKALKRLDDVEHLSKPIP